MGLLDFLRGTGAEPIPSGSDVSAGTYRCTECGKEIKTASVKSLPPCPQCSNNSWEALSGGDAAEDPYPKG
jgi:Zn finger protein HypA/HybF involved in hydrogenase expression